MKRSKCGKWFFVAAISAVVAALTAVAVLVLRSRKKDAWYDEDADFDFELEDDDMPEEFDEDPERED